MKQLIIGGVRSGKSRMAEQTAIKLYDQSCQQDIGKKLIYLATAQSLDSNMQARIEKHKEGRDERWQVIEEPINIASVLNANNNQNTIILIECMTLWVTNLLMLEEQKQLAEQQLGEEQKTLAPCQEHIQLFMQALQSSVADIVIVSSEVGQGIMPMNALARRYADELGELNQTLAQLSEKVTLVTAGLPFALK
ncbi:bifunctional adenosylcobinamide kinase/adenosylcobinamide-phosphate guanylyltransferase [Marinomonas agarivorans]|nr:bifunctional adenosylcobinamide kinase/adenosylcobinamide-phosphate guanylyltransferase [Marinomonas agarivorans]